MMKNIKIIIFKILKAVSAAFQIQLHWANKVFSLSNLATSSSFFSMIIIM